MNTTNVPAGRLERRVRQRKQRWLYVKETPPKVGEEIIVGNLKGELKQAHLGDGVYLIKDGGYLYLQDVKRYKLMPNAPVQPPARKEVEK